jgi:histidinol dehydrogenase
MTLFPRRTAAELAVRNSEVPAAALRRAREIIDRVRDGGEAALRTLTEEFGERQPRIRWCSIEPHCVMRSTCSRETTEPGCTG